MANQMLKRRSRRTRLLWIAATAVTLAAILLALQPQPAEADFVQVDRGDVRLEIVDEARTRMHEVYVISAPVAGRVLRVDIEVGDDVQKGATLARMAQAAAGFLDTRSDLQARAAVDAAQARLASAQADLALAQREHARTQQVAAAKLVAESAVDQSRARVEAMQAAHRAAEAELRRARSAVLAPERATSSEVDVRTPVTGRVLRVPQESEAVIAAGTPLVEVGDPTHIEVVAEFLSQDAVRMRPGAEARIENWGGPPLAARVERIEPVAHTKVSALGVEEQRTNVVLQFDGRAAATGLGHDYRVDARVVIDTAANALRVPLGALFRRDDGWATYKVEDGRVRLVMVSVGIADDSHRVVTTGLAEGDIVVNFPASTLAEGARVTARTKAR